MFGIFCDFSSVIGDERFWTCTDVRSDCRPNQQWEYKWSVPSERMERNAIRNNDQWKNNIDQWLLEEENDQKLYNKWLEPSEWDWNQSKQDSFHKISVRVSSDLMDANL